MARAKDIRVEFITRQAADAIIKRLHYSGKIVQNSQLHFGVFINGRLEGALQFGPSLDKRRMLGLVKQTPWHGFLELNRMAFSDALPRNSESRAISIALRSIKRHYPHIQWVVSFADATQCGDGTIYRASGFVLTGIKKNTSLWAHESGHVISEVSVKSQAHKAVSRTTLTKGTHVGSANGSASMKHFAAAGYKPLRGFQLRYVYFLDPSARDRLSVPVLPFKTIDELHAGMYLGRPKEQAPADHAGLGGVTPTRALQSEEPGTGS